MARFPSSPVPGEQYFDPTSGITYTWDGYKWETTSAPFNTGATGATGVAFGVYAFARTTRAGALLPNGNGIASVQRVTVQVGTVNRTVYRYTLSTPFADGSADYTVNAAYSTSSSGSGLARNRWGISVLNITPTTFDVFTFRDNNAQNDQDHTVAVYGVNALGDPVDGPSGSGSAYVSWLRTGNSSPIGGKTEQDFVEYLVGPPGGAGGDGATGATGPTGIQGATGPKGNDGTSVTLKGTVSAANRLNTTDTAPRVAGDLWVVLSDGDGYTTGDGAVYTPGANPVPGVPDWENIGKLQGPQGIQGPLGSTGATGPVGPVGPAATQGGFFVVVGERNGSLGGTEQYYALGNGASARNDFCIEEDCEIGKLTIVTQGALNGGGTGTQIFEVTVNGVVAGTLTLTNSDIDPNGPGRKKTQIFTTPNDIQITAGDNVAVRSAGGNGGGGRSTCSLYVATAGARGATGEQGPIGTPGGATGPIGPQGPIGSTGATGIQGATGPQGPIGVGLQGPIGPQGATGADGIQGPVGTKIIDSVADETELNSKYPSGVASGEGVVVETPSSGPINQVFVYNAGAFVSIGPIQGPPGATGIGAPGATGTYPQVYYKGTLVDAGTVNDYNRASPAFPPGLPAWRTFNIFTTPTFPNPAGFTLGASILNRDGVNAGGIIVPESGIYEAYFSGYFFSNDDRVSIGVRFAVSSTDGEEGAPQPGNEGFGAMGYIRQASNHFDSSVNFSTFLELATGDQVQVQMAKLASNGPVTMQGVYSNFTLRKIAELPI